MSGRRRLFVGLLGLAIGVIIGHVSANAIVPSRGELRSAARDFVPQDAHVLRAEGTTGSSLIVGDYSYSVVFEGGGTDAASVADLILTSAESKGWRTNRSLHPPSMGGVSDRDGIVVSILLYDSDGICDPVNLTVVEGVCGNIIAEAHEDDVARTRRIGDLIGGLVGAAVALLLIRRRPAATQSEDV